MKRYEQTNKGSTPPNTRIQPTASRARSQRFHQSRAARSRRLMRHMLGRAVPSLPWLSVSMATGTRHAQSRQPRQRACPPMRIADAKCPDRLRLGVASAYLDRAPAQHALVTVFTPCRCRSLDTVISACSIADAARSLMPFQKQRRLFMLWSQVSCFRLCSPRRGAAAGGSATCRVPSPPLALAQHAHPADAALRRARSRRF